MNHQDDLLWRQLKTIPAFRGLLRAVEARFYQQIEIPEPVLDIGCGDGHFAEMTFDHLTAGIDPWWGPLQKARKVGVHKLVTQSMGDQLPFADEQFASVISNSVLEHIPQVQAVLNEANRVLRPGGKLIITMPSHYFTEYLGGAAFLQRLGMPAMAERYRRFFNFISRHAHTDPPEVWARRLATAGFSIDHWQFYFSQEALRALEWGHVQGLPSAISHFVTGHWILGPWESSLRATDRWLRPFFEEEPPIEAGAYLLFVARKQGRKAIPPTLPPPAQLQPYRPDPKIDVAPAAAEIPPPAPSPPPAQILPDTPLDERDEVEPFIKGPGLLQKLGPTASDLALGLLALWFAMLGQASLAEATVLTGSLPWFALSVGMLALLGVRRRTAVNVGGWPRPTRRQWLVAGAFILMILATRQTGTQADVQRTGLALYLWLIAIGLGLYALWPVGAAGISLSSPRLARWEWVALLLLFGSGLLLRLANLTGHPFILSGTEASIGLDAWAVADGQITMPFGTGWLTNPNLPLFILSVPLLLFGRSVLAIRLLSPLAGALAIPVVYLVGRRFWGPPVGLIAAILLAGSHVHIHYSRLGMTNIWDPLVVLITMGLFYHAWQSRQRPAWLLAGLAAGFNAYFFTSAHLFPLMLLALAGLLLFRRSELWERRYELLGAVLIALLVAWPQISYYRSNPGIFMDRANSLGILQSGWLVRETANSGQQASVVLGNQLWQGLLAFNTGIDSSNAYNSGRSLFGYGTAVLFVIGLGLALLRLRQLRFGLIVVWLVVSLLFAGALMESPPSSHRLLIATPAVTLLAGLGLAWLGQHLVNTLKLNSHYLLPALATAAVLLTLSDVSFYFGKYRSQPTFGDRNTEAAHEIADYLNDLEGAWTAYFFGPPSMYSDFPTFPFLLTELGGDLRLVDVNPGENVPDLASEGNTVYIYLPERAAELDTTRSQYPGGRESPFAGIYGNPLFYVYEIGP